MYNVNAFGSDQYQIISTDTTLTEKEKEHMLSLGGEDEKEEIEAMLQSAQEIAAPKALCAMVRVEDKTEDSVTLCGVKITCPLMRRNFDPVQRVFPHVASCASELEQWSRQYDGDPLCQYWADELKKLYLGHAVAALHAFVQEKFGIRQLSKMSPGSLKDWPITAQRQLFSILGSETIEKNVGVRLTESMLMLPSKSVSGILFQSADHYENCQFCPMVGCPNRRAKFSGETGFVKE